MSNMTLTLKHIRKSFGRRVIIDDITYSFEGGHIYAIVGESGCGKTTLLNILGCLDNRYSGEILIDGKIVNPKIDNHQLRNDKIGFVFQSFYLIDYLDVEGNIKMPLDYSNKTFDLEYLNYLVDKLNLSSLIHEKVTYLSGGEKQRVAIARALINHPQIILCDEPTGNLDMKNANQVSDILKEFMSDDKVIIIVTHDQDIANNCDYILSLKEGKLYEEQIKQQS